MKSKAWGTPHETCMISFTPMRPVISFTPHETCMISLTTHQTCSLANFEFYMHAEFNNSLSPPTTSRNNDGPLATVSQEKLTVCLSTSSMWGWVLCNYWLCSHIFPYIY